MQLSFTKMHGLGNDFVMLDGYSRAIELSEAQIRAIADRHFGVGCDQLLMVEPPRHPEARFRYHIFNADGSEVEQCGNGARCFARFVRDLGLTRDTEIPVEQCGNGARCFARFVRDLGLTRDTEIPVETAAGLIQLRVQADGQVTVDMGAPIFAPEQVPFQAESQADTYTIEALGEAWTIGAVSMGNPHAVLQVDDVDTAPVETLGPALESHPRFPQRVNVGFLQPLSRTQARLRVYERGSGETLACGSGACAAVVAGQVQGLFDEVVTVSLPGGDLVIEWRGPGESVMMTGPATRVFDGQIEL